MDQQPPELHQLHRSETWELFLHSQVPALSSALRGEPGNQLPISGTKGGDEIAQGTNWAGARGQQTEVLRKRGR